MNVQEKNIFYLDMKFYPQWDIDLILLLKNDFPFKKYLTILIENYIEGKPSPKIINWFKYIDANTSITTNNEDVERIRISFDLNKYSPNFKDFFVNGVESRKRSAFCKALLRSAIDYGAEAPYEVKTKTYCISFNKISDLDLITLANKYDIGKMIYDTLENIAISYTTENVEPLYFYIDDYDTTKQNKGKSFSISLNLISDSAVASLLSQCTIDVSQFCKSIFRSRIIAQNLSSYLCNGYEYYDKRIHDEIDLSNYNNIRLCSEYAIAPGSTVHSHFQENASCYIVGTKDKKNSTESFHITEQEEAEDSFNEDESIEESSVIEHFDKDFIEEDSNTSISAEEPEQKVELNDDDKNVEETFEKNKYEDEEMDMHGMLSHETLNEEDSAEFMKLYANMDF